MSDNTPMMDKLNAAMTAFDPNHLRGIELSHSNVVNLLNRFQVPPNPLLTNRILEFARNYPKYLARYNEPPTIDATAEYKFTKDQERAWDKFQDWLPRGDPIFRIKGAAGTGKTFWLKRVLEHSSAYNFYFTAPTNKAAGVISDTLGRDGATIYSLLGIRMRAYEDKIRLVYPQQQPRIPTNSIIVLDECHMVGRKLNKFVQRVCRDLGLRILYMGDPYQFNPVGERAGPVWQMELPASNRVTLHEVMRFDNQLLNLAIKLRDCIRERRYDDPIASDNKDDEGVFVFSRSKFERDILQLDVADFQSTKVIVWRNRIAEYYTDMIRRNFGFTKEYHVGETLLLADPIEDKEGKILAHIDEEGIITSCQRTEIEIEDIPIRCWAMVLKSKTRIHKLNVPVKDNHTLYDLLSRKAATARNAKEDRDRRRAWYEYHQIRRQFHRVRHGYALTSHRIMGSTLDKVYVDRLDLLTNPRKREAFRGLYVASTRARKQVITY